MSGAAAPVTASESAAGPAPRLQEALVVLRLGGAEFGVPISSVREVLRTPPISRVPFTPVDVCGAVALRGSVLPVVDLGLRLLRRPAQRPGSLLVVLPAGTTEPLGLLVDAILELTEADGAEVIPPPPEIEATLPPGWAKAIAVPAPARFVTILDLPAVLATGNAAQPPEHGPDADFAPENA
jgi:purine-binding chemotaxis protein CheW